MQESEVKNLRTIGWWATITGTRACFCNNYQKMAKLLSQEVKSLKIFAAFHSAWRNLPFFLNLIIISSHYYTNNTKQPARGSDIIYYYGSHLSETSLCSAWLCRMTYLVESDVIRRDTQVRRHYSDVVVSHVIVRWWRQRKQLNRNRRVGQDADQPRRFQSY